VLYSSDLHPTGGAIGHLSFNQLVST